MTLRVNYTLARLCQATARIDKGADELAAAIEWKTAPGVGTTATYDLKALEKARARIARQLAIVGKAIAEIKAVKP
jgi:hypothetical protein